MGLFDLLSNLGQGTADFLGQPDAQHMVPPGKARPGQPRTPRFDWLTAVMNAQKGQQGTPRIPGLGQQSDFENGLIMKTLHVLKALGAL